MLNEGTSTVRKKAKPTQEKIPDNCWKGSRAKRWVHGKLRKNFTFITFVVIVEIDQLKPYASSQRVVRDPEPDGKSDMGALFEEVGRRYSALEIPKI